MNLVDVHCHLNHELFKDDLDQVLERATKAGIKRVLISGVNPAANRAVLELAKKDPSLIKVCLGIYPIDALGLSEGETGLPRQTGKIDIEEEFAFIKKHLSQVAAIGEIGMDFHWAEKEKTGKQQEENFRKIIQFAISVKKPIIIHSREAERECIDIMKEEIKNHEIPVINHCFSGRKSVIKDAAALGHYFSIPPNIVKSQQFQTLVEIVDIKQLLTETDSPWLSPFKDQKNEPAFVVETIKKIAEIKKLTVEETAQQIWDNYVRVFGE